MGDANIVGKEYFVDYWISGDRFEQFKSVILELLSLDGVFSKPNSPGGPSDLFVLPYLSERFFDLADQIPPELAPENMLVLLKCPTPVFVSPDRDTMVVDNLYYEFVDYKDSAGVFTEITRITGETGFIQEKDARSPFGYWMKLMRFPDSFSEFGYPVNQWLIRSFYSWWSD